MPCENRQKGISRLFLKKYCPKCDFSLLQANNLQCNIKLAVNSILSLDTKDPVGPSAMTIHRDVSGFLLMIESHKGIIYKVARLYGPPGEAMKDLIQEIILQLWLAFPNYKEQYKVSTWMYRIALNVSISSYRKEYRREKINQSMPDDVLYILPNEDTKEEDTRLSDLYKYIKELKEIDRAIMILYLEEKSYQDMAEVLGMTVTSISTRISRIKQQLKEKFSHQNQ